ncbi:MAG: guanylate kinase [Bacteroidetes bacterium]|nr:guanylate kinase [Bacteroidota bacterium]
MSHEFHVVVPPKKIIVITAPSGAGKSTIVRKLIKQRIDLEFSISLTTRERREGEVDGKDYYFVTHNDFQQRVQKGDLVEHEEVYPGQYYGTLRSEIERIWSQRKIAIFDMDVKGAENIKKAYGKDALVIFIAPPDKETLARRLTNRNTESKDSLKKRIKKAEQELSYRDKADKVVVNDDFDIAFMNVKNVITNFLKQSEAPQGAKEFHV